MKIKTLIVAFILSCTFAAAQPRVPDYVVFADRKTGAE